MAACYDLQTRPCSLFTRGGLGNASSSDSDDAAGPLKVLSECPELEIVPADADQGPSTKPMVTST